MVTPRKGNFARLGGHTDPGYLPSVGLYVARASGVRISMEMPWRCNRGTLLAGGCGRTPQRRAESEAGSSAPQLALGSQSGLICVDRTHSHQHGPGRRRSLGGGGVGAGSIVPHGGEHDVGESPFQAAEGFAFGFAGGAFAFVVGATFGVAADLGERDGVEGPVELAVSAGVEPVSDGAA